MFDIPVADNVQIVQEYVINEARAAQSSHEALYQMSEVDLSFYDALASQCSGGSSSAGSGNTKIRYSVEIKTTT